MKTDLLQQYITLRSSLERQREEIVARLRQIEDVLGSLAPSTLRGSGKRGRGGNPMPLRDAILRVTAHRGMTKQEIYEAVKRLGYRFTTKDPFNVIGVVVYGKNPRFRNDNGRFSPIGGTTIAPTRRRTMSLAG